MVFDLDVWLSVLNKHKLLIIFCSRSLDCQVNFFPISLVYSPSSLDHLGGSNLGLEDSVNWRGTKVEEIDFV